MIPMDPEEIVARNGRITNEYADERVREKIERYQEARQREGLAKVNEGLKEAGVSPYVRLHLISTVADLGKVSEATLAERLERAAAVLHGRNQIEQGQLTDVS
ncbi:MAG TPA: hypothetical protein VNZ52_04395 [Candidatus Thermoplasmatota archaeon]|nr:hypothetical protein [Candidatus Thermoplasmatota archaeon]